MFRKTLLFLSIILTSVLLCRAQVEVAHAKVKDFNATGFGIFMNFSMHVSAANYATFEGGLQYFRNRYDEGLALIPVLLGYRYTFNHSGSGLYIEPGAGYNFGSSTIEKSGASRFPISYRDGTSSFEKVSGPVLGGRIGYLFQPIDKIQFNLGLSFARTFGDAKTNVVALRITHAFNFGGKDGGEGEGDY